MLARLPSPAPALLSLLLLGAGTVLSGCDTVFGGGDEGEMCTTEVRRITGVEITPIDRRGNTYVFSDTLRGQVAFSIEALSEQVDEREVKCLDDPRVDRLGVITTNPVRLGPEVLRFNQPIVARGERIEAGTNLMAVGRLSEDYSIRGRFGPGGITEIKPDLEIYDFPAGRYRSYFEWVATDTTEGKTETFSDSVEVYIDVQ